MKIVCDNKIPFLKGALEPYAEVLYLPGADTTAQIVRNADALITRTRTRCNRELLEGSSVKMIATATIGFDHIDTEWCEANGIRWTNAPGCNSWSVQQYIASVLVKMADSFHFRYSDMTLGVVGVGNVGSKVAHIASVLGFKVLLNDPPRARREGNGKFVTLDEIIGRSDIITCHVPLQRNGEDTTYHLFDADRLASLQKGQILINSSRGEIVDNQALKDVLKAGSIKAAALDVWENEPDIDRELLDELFIGTPHIAGYSIDGKANGTEMSVRAIAAALGLPCTDWCVNGIPLPLQPTEFTIDATGKTTQQVLGEAVLHTYDVRQDDMRLRENPSMFERQRADYPIRREFTAFTINLVNGSDNQAAKLKEMGFILKN